MRSNPVCRKIYASQDTEYFYDSNGNLAKDLEKNTTSIQYNCLNLPSRIEFEDGNTVSYVYSADGTKLQSTHVMGGVSTVTEYCGNVVYENGIAKLLLTQEGYISLNDDVYHYFIQDHQGNNRVVIDQNGTMEETNHYYPFGGVFASSSSVQPYKYNGKELDTKNDLNWYDYGARHYDAAIGRWHVVDPMSEKYFAVSPYVYCMNNPINIVDPDGRDWYWDKDKTRQFDPNINEDSRLAKGQSYIGKTDVVKDKNGNVLENYRDDGSIMFAKEASGYKRMISNSLKTGKEEMGVITNEGILVVPDHKNTSHGVDLADYDYGVKNGNVVDAKGTEFKTVATAHTHPDGSGPSTWDLNGNGDLIMAGLGTPHKPVYVLQMTDAKVDPISFIISGPNLTKKYSGFNNFGRYNIPKSMLNVQSLLNGASLRRFTIDNKVGNLRRGK